MITGAARVAGVIGWPVKHSLSPLIHNAWIEALGLDAVYVPFAVPPEDFDVSITGLRSGGVCGLNVTMPLKAKAYMLADLQSDSAHNSNAANLLLFNREEVTFADNTDGVGLLGALQTAGWVPSSGPVLILGSGGAAVAAADALLRSGVGAVRIAARKYERGSADWDPTGLGQAPFVIGQGSALTFGLSEREKALDGVTAIINATSAGLNGVGELPPMNAAPSGAVFMDMVYSPLRTKFLRDAAARGHPTIDGLAMLIGQARPSFEAFFGVSPPPPEIFDVRALCLKALGEAG